MKNMIYYVIIAAGIFSGNLFCQTVANDATPGVPGGKLKLVRTKNGTSLVNTSPEGIKLYAEFKNWVVIKWTAIDMGGSNISAAVKTVVVDSVTVCWVCLAMPPQFVMRWSVTTSRNLSRNPQHVSEDEFLRIGYQLCLVSQQHQYAV